MTRLQVLNIMAGSLLWAFALSLALYRTYEPVPGMIAGIIGAFFIESAWSNRSRS